MIPVAEYKPITEIRVLSGIPLDSSYSDTILFDSEGAQQGFFAGKAKQTFTQCSYQRVSSSIALPRVSYTTRVPCLADDIEDCNYLMFKNNTKWYYAFITSINYINPENTEIVYQIDYFQTYLFQWEMLPCMVLREHPKTDELFGNLEPESFGEMDMMINNVNDIKLSERANIVVGVSTDPQGKTVAGNMSSGVYSGVELHYFTDAASATAFIRSYDDKAKAEGIVTVFMSPWGDKTDAQNVTLSLPSSLGGYVPRNKKLLSYPYVKIEVSNKQGEIKDFYYEFFSTFSGSAKPAPKSPVFRWAKFGGIEPACYLFPLNYRGTDGKIAYDYVLEVSGFPQCAWTSNAYANWKNGEMLAQAYRAFNNYNTASLDTTLSTSGASGLAKGGSSSEASLVFGYLDKRVQNITNLAGNLKNLQIEAQLRKRCPGLTKGSAHSAKLNLILDEVGYYIKEMSITPEMASSIDDFFDAYGYATNRMKVPEMKGRNAWNYVQTYNCIIKGSMPVQAMDLIKACFNNGIRLWHNGEWVGDYSKPNYPV
ncbi:MAG: tail protein [Podoviridae sp. ctjc_2]|nr:MAG: tail protein [Podoviridae sp. ctjc_2]